MPFLTDSRTRSSFVVPRALSMVTTRRTKRSVRSRMSRVSTKPVSDTENIGRASTPCAIRAVFQVATAKPAATAAIITAAGKNFCRRNSTATAHSAIATMAATDSAGS
ncbi:hypothetical protein V1273_003958 [Bradyrhizobium sp. AZCC 1721]